MFKIKCRLNNGDNRLKKVGYFSSEENRCKERSQLIILGNVSPKGKIIFLFFKFHYFGERSLILPFLTVNNLSVLFFCQSIYCSCSLLIAVINTCELLLRKR